MVHAIAAEVETSAGVQTLSVIPEPPGGVARERNGPAEGEHFSAIIGTQHANSNDLPAASEVTPTFASSGAARIMAARWPPTQSRRSPEMLFSPVRLCVMAAVVAVAAAAPGIPERARGAKRVVVAQVVHVQSVFATNEHGDQLIVSRARIQIEEALKGAPASYLNVEVEGGTVGDLTLQVSDMPRLETGDRAVFFLTPSDDGTTNRPHLRGLGILKLRSDNVVRGSSLSLDAIRGMVANAK
jgi:hypothetical protein